MLSSLQNPLPFSFPDTHQFYRKGVHLPPPIESMTSLRKTNLLSQSIRRKSGVCHATLLENPIFWAGRLCGFYALLKAGLAGTENNPILSESGEEILLFKWLEGFQGKSDEATEKRKLVSKWHPTTKGTLKRSYRVPSKTGGKRLLRSIASLLSDDDQFRDATSHKGCQIRRENAHAETVCCNNVRAMFDELPTPHLVVEITAFPAGPLTENDYAKAEKLERVLKSSASI